MATHHLYNYIEALVVLASPAEKLCIQLAIKYLNAMFIIKNGKQR